MARKPKAWNIDKIKELVSRIADDQLDNVIELIGQEKTKRAESGQKLEEEIRNVYARTLETLRGAGMEESKAQAAAKAAADTLRAEKSKKGTRPKKAPKYRIIDSEGKEVTWSGQGRKPNAIQAALDNGANLEDFLI